MQSKLITEYNDISVIDFLRESNAIENVFDLESLGNALLAWAYLSTVKVLTVKDILKTHRILMKGKLEKEDTGMWRHEEVMIAGRLGHPYKVVPGEMQMWVFEMAKRPMTFAENSKLHVQYEHIHPFIDGNGRTGRMFYLWNAIKHQIPAHWITNDNKREYYQWF